MRTFLPPLAFLPLVAMVALATAQEVEAILRQEKSLLDALDGYAFESRRAQQALDAAVEAGKDAESRQSTAAMAADEARSREKAARDGLAATLRLAAASAPFGTVASLMAGGYGDDAARRRALVDRLLKRQASELVVLDSAARAAEVAEFKAGIERANAHAIAEAGREARGRLDAEKASRKSLLAALEKDRALRMRAVKELGDAERALLAAVESRLSRAAAPVPFERLKGSVRWPLAGADVAEPFGDRVHPEFKTVTPHPGLTLSFKGGPTRNVRAVAFGKVVFAGPMRGYGTTLVLDHASGYFSVYAGMSAVSVRDGEIVREGDVIGKVEHAGDEEELRLYFELRRGKEPLDPLPYLAKKGGKR